MDISEELNLARRRLAQLEAALANRAGQSEGRPWIGQVIDGGAMPTTVPRVYLVRPYRPSWPEQEGATWDWPELSGQRGVPVLVLGPEAPEEGTGILVFGQRDGRFVGRTLGGRQPDPDPDDPPIPELPCCAGRTLPPALDATIIGAHASATTTTTFHAVRPGHPLYEAGVNHPSLGWLPGGLPPNGEVLWAWYGLAKRRVTWPWNVFQGCGGSPCQVNCSSIVPIGGEAIIDVPVWFWLGCDSTSRWRMRGGVFAKGFGTLCSVIDELYPLPTTIEGDRYPCCPNFDAILTRQEGEMVRTSEACTPKFTATFNAGASSVPTTFRNHNFTVTVAEP